MTPPTSTRAVDGAGGPGAVNWARRLAGRRLPDVFTTTSGTAWNQPASVQDVLAAIVGVESLAERRAEEGFEEPVPLDLPVGRFGARHPLPAIADGARRVLDLTSPGTTTRAEHLEAPGHGAARWTFQRGVDDDVLTLRARDPRGRVLDLHLDRYSPHGTPRVRARDRARAQEFLGLPELPSRWTGAFSHDHHFATVLLNDGPLGLVAELHRFDRTFAWLWDVAGSGPEPRFAVDAFHAVDAVATTLGDLDRATCTLVDRMTGLRAALTSALLRAGAAGQPFPYAVLRWVQAGHTPDDVLFWNLDGDQLPGRLRDPVTHRILLAYRGAGWSHADIRRLAAAMALGTRRPARDSLRDDAWTAVEPERAILAVAAGFALAEVEERVAAGTWDPVRARFLAALRGTSGP